MACGQYEDDRANNLTEFQHMERCCVIQSVIQRYSCNIIWQWKQS